MNFFVNKMGNVFRISFILLGIVLYLYVKPPVLKWDNNSCWNNSTFQVLRNIKPLTEDFLAERNEQIFEEDITSSYELNNDDTINEFLKSYVNLLANTLVDTKGYGPENFERLNQDVEKHRGLFHLESLKLLQKASEQTGDEPEYTEKNGTIEKASGFDPANFLQDGIINTALEDSLKAKKLFLKYTEIKIHQKPNLMNPDLEDSQWVAFGNKEWLTYAEQYTDKDNNIKSINNPSYFSHLSDYFIQYNPGRINSAFPIDFNIDLTQYVSGDMKKENWNYELIGLVCGESITHVYAYILDQFESKPEWYLCDDFKGIVELKKPNKKDFDTSYIAVYKRIKTSSINVNDETGIVTSFAQALNDLGR